MKVAVVGLGAVGGLIAARLARAGLAVSALAAVQPWPGYREHGLLVDSVGKRSVAPHRRRRGCARRSDRRSWWCWP